MLAIGDTILRAANFIVLVLALGLTASLAATTVTHTNPQVNFAVFAATFAILTSSIYGVGAYFLDKLAWPVLLALFDALNFIFTFAAATAIAAAIHVHSCSNESYVDSNTINQGSSGRCRKAQASAAFLYISTFLFLISAAFSVLAVTKGGLFGHKSAGPRVSGV